MKILLWHVHGSWTTAFVQGRHEYLLPVLPDRGSDGLGRACTWDWPATAVERTPAQLATEDIDLVVLQRPHESELVRQWTGRAPGRDLPAVYLEHNAPHPGPVESRHVVAERADIPVVHVTHFNALYWDVGRAPSFVIEHGVVDPGELYTGELPHAAVVINEPVRRGRVVGTDLLPSFAAVAPVELFGAMDGTVAGVSPVGELAHDRLHRELGRRRVYVHPARWTSLGLSLIEAMHVGMPVVAVAATEVGRAVPAECGTVSDELAQLLDAVRFFVAEPEAAMLAGKAARRHALERYGLARFLRDWDRVLEEVTR
jgi:glycosyltransferase involved in cell wall biosynthesis